MGDWGVQPADNDVAQEWLVNSVAAPMLEAIKRALGRLLEDASDDQTKIEAEVAVALLLDLTADVGGLKYIRFNVSHVVSYLGLWVPAVDAIKTLLSQKEWLANWGDPQIKGDVLNRLLAELEVVKKRTEQETERFNDES
jgi:hypothetical protein